MARIELLEPTQFGTTDILIAQGARAGNWIFLNGHEATDFATGLAPEVRGNPLLPHSGLPRYRREGDYILERFARLLASQGSDLAHAVRLDQYYPDWRAVDPYHRSRRKYFTEFIPPSTSVLMREMLVPGAGLDVSLLAVMPGDDRKPKQAHPKDVPVPEHSGFVPSISTGDFVMVAGQMANDETSAEMHPRAHKPEKMLWAGTPIRLQTEFMIESRLGPALEAGGSSLGNAVKAQVYLSDIGDTAEFLDVWNAYFGSNPCALTVVPTSGFGYVDGVIEINIMGVRNDGATRKQVIECDVPTVTTYGPPAVRAGDLLLLSGLCAANAEGPLGAFGSACGLPYHSVGASQQARAIVAAAATICESGGSSLEDVVRILHFHTDLHEFQPAYRVWHETLNGQPVPLGAVGVPAPMPVPGCTLLADIWAYAPQ